MALNIIMEDECCGPRLGDALRDDENLPSAWTCPSCGQEWRAEMCKLEAGEGMRMWTPFCPVLIFR